MNTASSYWLRKLTSGGTVCTAALIAPQEGNAYLQIGTITIRTKTMKNGEVMNGRG